MDIIENDQVAIVPSRMERFNLTRGWFVTRWRIVDMQDVDIVQPWFDTRADAIQAAKDLGYSVV
jgi:hypothetical protein